MVNLKGIWNESVYLWKPVFVRAWPWLLFVTATDEILTMGAGALRSIDESYFIVAMITVVIIQLLLSSIGVIVINQMIVDIKLNRTSSVRESLQANFKYVFIESARAFLPVLLKLLLFIIPGIIEAVRLYFVPYIAQFDPDYKAGKIDALEKSRQICRGHVISVILILILTFTLSMVPSYVLESIVLLSSPIVYIAIFLGCMALELYSAIVLFQTYEKLSGVRNGDSISLQRTSHT